MYVFIGSETAAASGSAGISVFTLDEAAGRLTPVAETGGIDFAIWLAVDAKRNRLYAVSANPHWNEGLVAAYDVDPHSGVLSYLNKQSALGNIPCHLALSPDAQLLVVANYAVTKREQRPDQSIAVFSLGDGELPPAAARARHEGTGPNSARQERPHPHHALFSPDGRLLFIADLGIDKLVAYRVGGAGVITPAPELDVSFGPGRGPRHAAFHPDGRTIFVVHELEAGVSVVSFDGERTRLVSTVDIPYPQHVDPSGIALSPDGRFLYAAVRAAGDIVGFAVSEDRSLSEIGRWPAGGQTPRDIRLTPSGRLMFAANQDAGLVTVFRRNEQSGALELLPESGLKLETPMCFGFLPRG